MSPKPENFQIKKLRYFTYVCSTTGGSNEYQQSMFFSRKRLVYFSKRWTYLNFIMPSFQNWNSPIFLLLCVQSQLSRFFLYFTATSVKCRVAAIQFLPSRCFTIMQITFLFPLGSLSPFWLLWKSNTTQTGAIQRIQLCKLHSFIWRNFIKPNLKCSSFVCSSLSKGTLFIFRHI